MKYQRSVAGGLARVCDADFFEIVIGQAREILRHEFRHRDNCGRCIDIDHVAACFAEPLLWLTDGLPNQSTCRSLAHA